MTVMDSFRLDGKVAVVTGASAGLGVAFAQGLADAGADLVLAARRTDGLERTAEDIRTRGVRALVVATDVTDPDASTRMVTEAMDRLGAVDILVNNAGVGAAVPASRESPEHFRSVIEVNLSGSYWVAQACARVMRPGSSIVNVSSILGHTTMALPQAAYSASKAGLNGLTRDLAQQWTGRKGIRVNAIAPGLFASEMTAKYDDEYVDSVTRRILLGRMGDAAELAACVVWLASPAGGYVTGQVITVDGGVSIT